MLCQIADCIDCYSCGYTSVTYQCISSQQLGEIVSRHVNVRIRSAMLDKAKADALCVMAAGGSCLPIRTLQKAAGNADDVWLWAALTHVPHRCIGA